MSDSQEPYDQGAIRRRALKRFMQANKLTASDWAQRAGLPSPNAIYNFLNGRSDSLNQRTYELLARAVPGATVSMLTGEPNGVPGMNQITVTAAAAYDIWNAGGDLPAAEQYRVSVPATHIDMPGIYGIGVADDSCDLVYPSGTILVCVPYDEWSGGLPNGRRVVLQRHRADKTVEVTVREAEADESGQIWLWLRSKNPRKQGAVPIPMRHKGGKIKLDDGGPWAEIAGVVIASYRAEI